MDKEIHERQTRLEESLETALKGLGFNKKGRLFTRRGKGIHHVAMLSRSRFAPITMLDVGVLHDDLEEPALSAPMVHWHLNARLEGLHEDFQRINMLMDASTDIPDDVRCQELTRALQQAQRSFFERFQDQASVEAFIRAGAHPTIAVSHRAKQHFDAT